MKTVTCNRCHVGGFHWVKQSGKWYLLDSQNKPHYCKGGKGRKGHSGHSPNSESRKSFTVINGRRVYACDHCSQPIRWVMSG